MTLILGWGLGFLLAAPHLLPLLEYAQTGSRMVHRSEGTEERPPVGLAALPQVVLPDIYGTTEQGSTFIPPGYEPNLMESTTAAYTGVFAMLLVAPRPGAAGVIAQSIYFGFFSRSSALAGLLMFRFLLILLPAPDKELIHLIYRSHRLWYINVAIL